MEAFGLNLLIFLPLIAAVVVWVLPARREALAPKVALAVGAIVFVVAIGLFLRLPAAMRSRRRRAALVGEFNTPWFAVGEHVGRHAAQRRGAALPRRPRRDQHAARRAHRRTRAACGLVQLRRDPHPHARVLRLAARADDRHVRRLRRPRRAALLHLLRVHAGAAVLPDRHLGRAAAALRGQQVLPVHVRRQRHHVRRHPVPRPPRCPDRPDRRDRLRPGAALCAEPQAPNRDASSRCCSSRSSAGLRSRCRCSRCTPGCRWRTPRPRPPAACCWPACCSSWAPTASCGSACRWCRPGRWRGRRRSASWRSPASSTAPCAAGCSAT